MNRISELLILFIITLFNRISLLSVIYNIEFIYLNLKFLSILQPLLISWESLWMENAAKK